jgi:glycosyltransferase involved in cell wall biosynthesis
MIPKIIHWCWFDKGDKKPLPPVVQQCISSWNKYCPGWEIKLWNEANFDITLNRFTHEAYDAGKLGFVPDYIRAYLLYTYGGVYLDADLELLQNIDLLLENKAFTGVENNYDQGGWLGTGIIGSEAGHPYFKALMDVYDKERFIYPDGSINIRCTSNYVFSNAFQAMYSRKIPKETTVFSDMKLYAKEILYPHNRAAATSDSVSLHHVMATWASLVSVVMPCYNAEKTIGEAIESVLSQTLEKFELIIVDDGSTDSTREIVRSYKDRRILLLENKHDFIGSLNLGMRRASAYFVARMDADDVMLPNRLRLQLDYMNAHPEVDLLGAGMQFFGKNDFLYRPVAGDVSLRDMLHGSRIAHPTVMIRMERMHKLPEFYRREYMYAEDYDLWLRMLDAGLVLRNIPDTVLRYRASEEQTTIVHRQEASEAVERIKARYQSSLTVIISFLNEGIEVERTLENIYKTAAVVPEIILINDASDDGYDYDSISARYGCRYVKHTTRKGVAASRDEGVELCGTEHFLLLDAHVEFYEAGWDLKLLSALKDHPDSILCCQTRVLWETRENARKSPSHTFGAYLAVDRTNILKCRWNHYDPDPDAPVVEVAVVLGGAYAATRRYWQHLHGLKGLINYGMDEELISMKCWMEGGRCLLLKEIVVGHIYRSRFPYPVKNDFVLNNKLFITELFFDGDESAVIQERLKRHYGKQLFERVWNGLDWERVREEREYLLGIARKDRAFFLFKNAELRG